MIVELVGNAVYSTFIPLQLQPRLAVHVLGVRVVIVRVRPAGRPIEELRCDSHGVVAIASIAAALASALPHSETRARMAASGWWRKRSDGL